MSRPTRIAEDAVERLLDRDIAAAACQRHDHLDLVMHVVGGRRIGEIAAAETRLSGFFWKKNGGSLFGSWPISIACAA